MKSVISPLFTLLIKSCSLRSGDEVSIKAKKDTKNYIYDMRDRIDSASTTLYSGAIHSEVDLEISGKGELFVVSENNNGIHTKDDLQAVKLVHHLVKEKGMTLSGAQTYLKGRGKVEQAEIDSSVIERLRSIRAELIGLRDALGEL